MTAVPALMASAMTSVSPGSALGTLPTPKARRITASGRGVTMARSRAAVIPGARSMTATSWRSYGRGRARSAQWGRVGRSAPGAGCRAHRQGAPAVANGAAPGEAKPSKAHELVLVARLPASR